MSEARMVCSEVEVAVDAPTAFGAFTREMNHTHVPWVYVDDLDRHFARAQAGGAAIVEGIHQHGYRGYVADDLEGNRWTFAQARPSMR